MRFLSVLLVLGGILLLLFQGAVAGVGTCTLDRDLDPVIVLGQAFPSFSGAPLDQLFVYGYRGGTWSQVPWQFDEVRSQWLVVSEDGKLDSDDQLVFMAADAGDQAPAGAWIDDASSRQYRRYEITVTDPIDPAKQGWAYLYRSTTLASTVSADYVTYDPVQYLAMSDQYSLGWIKRRFGVDWLEMNGSGINILDRSKGRIDLPGYGLYTEDDIEAMLPPPDLIRDGPVRIVVAMREGGAEKVLALGYQARLDYRFNLFTILPKAPSSVRISVDKSPVASGSIYYDANTATGVTVDGSPDTVATSPASKWFQISGDTGTFVQIMDWPAGVASTYYKDSATIDTTDTGDRMSYADCGFLVRNPGVRFVATVMGYVLPPNQPNVGATYLAYYQQPLQAQAAEQRYLEAPTPTVTPTATPTATRVPVYQAYLPVVLRNY